MTNVSELTGAKLDEWVGKAYGNNVAAHPWGGPTSYSTDWTVAGPIIERERIEVSPSVTPGDSSWSAWAYGRGVIYFGPTPLVAAMRAFVATRFGPTVPPPAVERRQVERCAAYRSGAEMRCKCGRTWDVGDPDAPTCGKATARDRRRP